MDILDKILAHQSIIVAQRKNNTSIKKLESAPYFSNTCFSLIEKIKNNNYPSIIAEFKRKSPSKPDININADIRLVPSAYQDAGAAALSILTNELFFGGSDTDIIEIRKSIQLPILRKEFIIDTYQLYEAKSMGADIVLLVAEALTKADSYTLAKQAKDLGLEVIMELHTEDQIDKINAYIDFIGINNRNLKDFSTSIDTSLKLLDKLPKDKIKISESGIHSAEDVIQLWQAGYQGFLIGEYFMRQDDPGQACKSFNTIIKNRLDEN